MLASHQHRLILTCHALCPASACASCTSCMIPPSYSPDPPEAAAAATLPSWHESRLASDLPIGQYAHHHSMQPENTLPSKSVHHDKMSQKFAVTHTCMSGTCPFSARVSLWQREGGCTSWLVQRVLRPIRGWQQCRRATAWYWPRCAGHPQSWGAARHLH